MRPVRVSNMRVVSPFVVHAMVVADACAWQFRLESSDSRFGVSLLGAGLVGKLAMISTAEMRRDETALRLSLARAKAERLEKEVQSLEEEVEYWDARMDKHITVNPWTGNKIILCVKGIHTVTHVKRMLCIEETRRDLHPGGCFRTWELIFAGKRLDDQQKLHNLGIGNLSTLWWQPVDFALQIELLNLAAKHPVRYITMDVAASETVDNLKGKIEDLEGIQDMLVCIIGDTMLPETTKLSNLPGKLRVLYDTRWLGHVCLHGR